ncbi:MAG TPA: GFA family protein [Cellvibrionaceae bacterium]|nr:GFA family protein [Cellvibrionaceae bacterium]HMW50288.1 GFA family protein [Cellvibrionaceae bacterium]HMW71425.1 GFA family protein [Cellvibrionaceae bacterium]HMY39575.1 GFA family protein [Marinagarivorans sp.]
MKYQGSCHCGKIAFDVEGEIAGVLACNCSICQRKGSLLWFVPREQLTLKTDPAAMSTYLFNKQIIQHHFCAHCGIHPFGEGVALNGATMAAVNVRCLDDIDLASLPVQHFDGRSG